MGVFKKFKSKFIDPITSSRHKNNPTSSTPHSTSTVGNDKVPLRLHGHEYNPPATDYPKGIPEVLLPGTTDKFSKKFNLDNSVKLNYSLESEKELSVTKASRPTVKFLPASFAEEAAAYVVQKLSKDQNENLELKNHNLKPDRSQSQKLQEFYQDADINFLPHTSELFTNVGDEPRPTARFPLRSARVRYVDADYRGSTESLRTRLLDNFEYVHYLGSSRRRIGSDYHSASRKPTIADSASSESDDGADVSIPWPTALERPSRNSEEGKVAFQKQKKALRLLEMRLTGCRKYDISQGNTDPSLGGRFLRSSLRSRITKWSKFQWPSTFN